jgi:hypothetical protein
MPTRTPRGQLVGPATLGHEGGDLVNRCVPAFGSLQDRHLQEDGSDGSGESRLGSREAIVSAIESIAALVIEMDQVTVDGLRDGSGDRGLVRGGGRPA